jgi:hypothetical protein
MCCPKHSPRRIVEAKYCGTDPFVPPKGVSAAVAFKFLAEMEEEAPSGADGENCGEE